jgi:tetratricopeptide (TPR) repeat protein
MVSTDRSKHFFQNAGLLWSGLIIFVIACIINQRTPRPELDLSKQETAININQDLLIFLSAGNKRLITDLMWVQTLLESDMEHYSKKDLSNWMFIRFNTISVLDPYFYQNYIWGGQYLSIVKDDLVGAAKLLEKGVHYFPDDYRLNYTLGFTYYFELNDYQKGLKFLEKVQHHPKAPTYMPSIVMKLKAELGHDRDALMAMVQDLASTTNDITLKERLKADLYALKAEKDLSCLNKKMPNCDTLDAFGVPYIKIGDRYHSQTPFIPYRLKKKGDNERTLPVTTIEDPEGY